LIQSVARVVAKRHLDWLVGRLRMDQVRCEGAHPLL